MTAMTTPAQTRVPMLIRDVPLNIRRALKREAVGREMSVTDRAGEILGKAFEVEYFPYGRRLPKDMIGGTTVDITIRVPPELRTKIRVTAASMPEGTVRGVVIEALANHYGISAPAPRRRPRLKKNRLAA